MPFDLCQVPHNRLGKPAYDTVEPFSAATTKLASPSVLLVVLLSRVAVLFLPRAAP